MTDEQLQLQNLTQQALKNAGLLRSRYGRIANTPYDQTVDLECAELLEKIANFILAPPSSK